MSGPTNTTSNNVADLLADSISDREIEAMFNISPQTRRKWAARGLLGDPLPTPGRIKRRSRANLKKLWSGHGGKAA